MNFINKSVFFCAVVALLSCLFLRSSTGMKIDFAQAKAIWDANNVGSSSSLSKVSPPTSNDCCSPLQWETLAWEVNQIGSIFHVIHYDAINKLVRWDRYGNLEKPGVYDVLILYTNYTTEPFRKEYLYRPDNDTCYLYGADEFNAWCFGSTSNQTYVGIADLSGTTNNVWAQTGNPTFRWGSTTDDCLPTLTSLTNDLTIFYNTTLGIADPSVFDLPQLCLEQNSGLLEHNVPKAEKKKFWGTF